MNDMCCITEIPPEVWNEVKKKFAKEELQVTYVPAKVILDQCRPRGIFGNSFTSDIFNRHWLYLFVDNHLLQCSQIKGIGDENITHIEVLVSGTMARNIAGIPSN